MLEAASSVRMSGLLRVRRNVSIRKWGPAVPMSDPDAEPAVTDACSQRKM